ncbi:MAG: hypothetical protein WCH75_14290 [Candidatus Binatia bacterium]
MAQTTEVAAVYGAGIVQGLAPLRLGEKNIRIRGVSRIGKFAQAAKAFKQSSAKDAKVRASSTAKEKNYGSKK